MCKKRGFSEFILLKKHEYEMKKSDFGMIKIKALWNSNNSFVIWVIIAM